MSLESRFMKLSRQLAFYWTGQLASSYRPFLGQRMQVSLGAFLDSPNSHLARRINLDLVWGEFSSNLTRLLEILKSPELKGQLNRADLFSQADAVNAGLAEARKEHQAVHQDLGCHAGSHKLTQRGAMRPRISADLAQTFIKSNS